MTQEPLELGGCPECGTPRASMRDRYCRKCMAKWDTTDVKAPRPAGGKMKFRSRLLLVFGALGIIGVIAAAIAGGGDSKKDSTSATASSNAKVATIPTAVAYKLRVTQLQCATDATKTRECKGTVTNISPKTITDLTPVVHWTGGTDSDFGTIDINPILPGQSADFTVFTTNANPQLNNYRLAFKKVFGEESDFPIEPLPAQ